MIFNMFIKWLLISKKSTSLYCYWLHKYYYKWVYNKKCFKHKHLSLINHQPFCNISNQSTVVSTHILCIIIITWEEVSCVFLWRHTQHAHWFLFIIGARIIHISGSSHYIIYTFSFVWSADAICYSGTNNYVLGKSKSNYSKIQ